MSEVDRLLEQFIAAYAAGEEADPAVYLGELQGTERAELGALISAYLERAPRQILKPEVLAASPANAIADEVLAELQTPTWKTVLPRARARAQLRRDQLVAQLAAALGVSGQEQKVADYYNQMEHGRLDPTGVSDRVLESLSKLIGESVEALRAAGRPGPAASPGTVFARQAAPDPDFADAGCAAPPGMRSPGTEGEPDEVDRLFTNG